MRICIIIPHYGKDELLNECLESLHNNIHIGGGFEDYSEYEIEKMYTFIHVENDNERGVGFTNSINNAIISNPNCDFYWLLNNDTIIKRNVLLPAIKFMLDHPVCGILGSKILYYDYPDRIHHGGTIQAFPNGVHKTGSNNLKDYNIATRERWVTGASILIRRDVINEIGLFDKNMVNYCSDSDYCYRARYVGWEVWYCPDFEVFHHIGQSANPDEEQRKIMEKDILTFRDKWIGSYLFIDLDREVF